MAKYEYEMTETKSEEVPNCPLCGYDDLKFWSYNRDESMHGAAAGVKCKRCGHEVKVDGNELHLDWGEDCQRAAIDEWKYQVARWGKNKPEVKPDVISLQKKLAATLEENKILKTVIALERLDVKLECDDYRTGFDDIKRKFFRIMDEFGMMDKKKERSRMKQKLKDLHKIVEKATEETRLDTSEVKQSPEAWEKLKSKAEEILAAEGNTVDDGIVGIELDCSGKLVDISYWTRCRGESYIEDEMVPIEWFSAGSEELRELWQKKRESDMRAMARAAKATKRRQKQLKAKQKELKKKREFATLKRMKRLRRLKRR